jgi:hypothetical protein
MDLSKFESIFFEMKQILEKYYNDTFLFEQIINSIKTNNYDEFKDKVISNTFWGGSGAFWEIAPDDEYEIRTRFVEAVKIQKQERRIDTIKYRRKYIELGENLIAHGFNNRRIDQVIDNLKTMNEKEIEL